MCIKSSPARRRCVRGDAITTLSPGREPGAWQTWCKGRRALTDALLHSYHKEVWYTIALMKHIAMTLRESRQKMRETERGELMKYFCERLNASRLRDGLPSITMARMGKTLEQIPTKDLYYLKRVCDDAGNFSKKFWWELDPEKHGKLTEGKQK